MTATLTRARLWITELDREAEEFAEQVAHALRRAIKAGTSKLGTVLTAQGEAEAAEPLTSLDDLAAIETAWRAEVTNNVIPAVERFMRLGADHALQELAVQAPVLFDMRHVAAEVHLSQAENRLRHVGTETWQRTRDQLLLGFQDGESIPEISKRVREVIASSEIRARTIARTEVISASNAGSLAQVRLLGDQAPLGKTWLATNDSRTRETHRIANGQTVELDDAFAVGGVSLDFPGDPTGPPDEVINCRCTITWETGEAFSIQVFHLAGKHNQASHGGGVKPVEGDASAVLTEANARIAMNQDGDIDSARNYYHGAQGSFVMNGMLRNDTKNPFYKRAKPNDVRFAAKKVEGMDRAFDEYGTSSTQDIKVYRGVGKTHPIGAKARAKPGVEFADDGFVSTTTSRDNALKYVSRSNAGGMTLEITIPAGTNVIGGDARESELIIPRGMGYRVTGAPTNGVVPVEVIPL